VDIHGTKVKVFITRSSKNKMNNDAWVMRYYGSSLLSPGMVPRHHMPLSPYDSSASKASLVPLIFTVKIPPDPYQR
jgi:hypothetical protein